MSQLACAQENKQFRTEKSIFFSSQLHLTNPFSDPVQISFCKSFFWAILFCWVCLFFGAIWFVCSFLAKQLRNFLLRDLKNVCHIMSTASRHELVQSLKIAPWRWLGWPRARLGSRRNKCDWNSLWLPRVLNSGWGLDETDSNDGTVSKKEGEWEERGILSPVLPLFPSLQHIGGTTEPQKENIWQKSVRDAPPNGARGKEVGKELLPKLQLPRGLFCSWTLL